MTIQQIQRLRDRRPFEAFRIVTADGGHYDVSHPENLAQTGNGRIIVVAMHDYAATLDLLLVTGVHQPIHHKKTTRAVNRDRAHKNGLKRKKFIAADGRR